MEEANLATELILLNEGKVIEQGAPSKLRSEFGDSVVDMTFVKPSEEYKSILSDFEGTYIDVAFTFYMYMMTSCCFSAGLRYFVAIARTC